MTVAELEKENARLKTDYEVLSCSVGDFDELQNKLEEEQRKNNGLSDNLTKAKEIIRELIHEISVFYIATDRTIISPTVKEAEQFISEVEK